jgi:hypothetical protein
VPSVTARRDDLALEARRASLIALKALEGAWSPVEGLTRAQVQGRWTDLTGAPPSSALLQALEGAFMAPSWLDEQGEGTRGQLLESRVALCGRLHHDLERALLPASRRWRARTARQGLPEALCAALPYLGVSVEDEQGRPFLCRPKEASRSLREGLSGFARLFHTSVERSKPFNLRPLSQEGLQFEALILCLLNIPASLLCALDARYEALFSEVPSCELIARPTGLYDDLALSRDISLKRSPDHARGRPGARGWLQVGMSALKGEAERKAHSARRQGSAQAITPHHLARSCPETHALWRYHDHVPRTHEGRALAIRGMFRRALAVRPSASADGGVRALFAPVLELPPPLVWQLICDAQGLIGRPALKVRRSADPSSADSG